MVVNDIYASPLSDLIWDDTPPLIPVPDQMPRVQGRPKSFIAGRQSNAMGAKRAPPPLPAIYDIPFNTVGVVSHTTNPPHHDPVIYDSPPSPQSIGISRSLIAPTLGGEGTNHTQLASDVQHEEPYYNMVKGHTGIYDIL